MNLNDSDDPLASLAPPACQKFHLSNEISPNLLDGLAQTVEQTVPDDETLPRDALTFSVTMRLTYW